jgi:hypothetical protein
MTLGKMLIHGNLFTVMLNVSMCIVILSGVLLIAFMVGDFLLECHFAECHYVKYLMVIVSILSEVLIVSILSVVV